MGLSRPDLPTSAREEILLRDKYHCTEPHRHRLTGEVTRCPQVGSEMVVVDGRAMCPHHARAFSTQEREG